MAPDSNLPPAIDPAALKNLLSIGGGDASFLREMMDIFTEDTPPRLAEIEQALRRAEPAPLAKAAHSLKGSASNFGAARFRGLAERIEHLARAGDLGPIPALLGDLRGEYLRVLAALRAAVPPPA